MRAGSVRGLAGDTWPDDIQPTFNLFAAVSRSGTGMVPRNFIRWLNKPCRSCDRWRSTDGIIPNRWKSCAAFYSIFIAGGRFAALVPDLTARAGKAISL